jgi:branched-chain amino acid aminotransferase
MSEATQYVWVDGKLSCWDEATVHITQIGLATVSAVFEGIRVYWNDTTKRFYVFQLDAHLHRLAQSIRLMRMKQPFSNIVIKKAAIDLLRVNKCKGDSYVRPLAFVESAVFSHTSNDKARMVLSTKSWPSRLKSNTVSHACISSWTRLGDNQMPPRVKAASNYLNSRLAAEEALRNGYDTAVLLNSNGKVAEAPVACLMIVRDGKIITPPVTSGILESITRATVIQLCHEVLNLEVIEREVDRTELYLASEVFACGTGEEITPIVSVDRFELGDGGVGPITRQLENLYNDLVRGIDTRYPEWRTLV